MRGSPPHLTAAIAGRVVVAALLVGGLLAGWVVAQQAPSLGPDLAPTDVQAADDPDDDSGAQAIITWTPPAAEPPEGLALKGYRIHQAQNGGEYRGLLKSADAAPGPDGRMAAPVAGLWTWRTYRFKVAALYGPDDRENWYMQGQVVPEADPERGLPVLVEEAISDASEPVRTVAEWYDVSRTTVLVGTLLFSIIAIWYISRARRGKEIYIRPIAGVEAIDEAIGRATEMGKPILYVAGLSGLGSISTITSMTILGRVARRTAEYETPLLVPCFDPLVMLAAREIVREAYLDAGKPDAYREQDIFFVTDRQFAYVAAVDGIMVRERPAANLYMGYFFAEALILAETGAEAGAIQIAGTDADTQIPFFVTACDYTLMGEELYAATAYLSREPMLLAQLKAQDAGKAFSAVLVTLGGLAATAAVFLAVGEGWMARAADTIGKCIDTVAPR